MSLNLALVACGGGTAGDGGVQSDSGADAVADPCAPTTGCPGSAACIALADNRTTNPFAVRVANWTFTRPAALGSGIQARAVVSAIEPDLQRCNESGQGTTNVLLEFDTTASTLTLGGARAVVDPTSASMPYSFFSGTLGATMVAPVSTPVTLAAGGMFTTTASAFALNLPLFLNLAGTVGIVLPLSSVTVSGQLSADHDCVGSYNGSTLDPANSCQPDSTHPQFTSGGTLTGQITLQAADAVIVAALDASLCVVLSGDAATYGDGMPTAHCKTDPTSGAIVFQGDWCAATNAAATAGCADAMRVDTTFAASATHIH